MFYRVFCIVDFELGEKMGLSDSGNLRLKLREVFANEASWVPSSLNGVAKKSALKLLNIGIGQAIPFLSRNKFKVVDMKHGYLKAKIPLKGNKNHFGGMYAGALFTVAEAPGGVIAILNFDSGFYPILKELQIKFKKVAKSDVTVEYEMSEKEMAAVGKETEKKGKCDFILNGIVKDKDDNVVAEAKATYQLRVSER